MTDALRVFDTPSVHAALLELRDAAQAFQDFAERTRAAHEAMAVAAGLAASEAGETPAQQAMDKTLRVVRSTARTTPFNFNPDIDAYSAVVSVLVATGQGYKFANSVASRICYGGHAPRDAISGADRTDYVPPTPRSQNLRLRAIPRRPDGWSYRCVYVAVFGNRLTILTASVTVIWLCGE
jgi:hypothetical protein